MKTSPLLLCALLAISAAAHAAPAAEKDAPPAAPVEQHSADDGHDHGGAGGGPKINEGSMTDYLWRRSDAAFHAGDYPRAIELHRAIVAADPADFESFGVGAWLLWSMDKRAEADAFIAQGLKENPDNWEMWDAAGKQYGLEKDYPKERDAYGKAVALAGKDADMMMVRRFAHATQNAGDLSGSATIWRGLVEAYPTDAVNKNNLARVEKSLEERDGKAAVKTMGALGLGRPDVARSAAVETAQGRGITTQQNPERRGQTIKLPELYGLATSLRLRVLFMSERFLLGFESG